MALTEGQKHLAYLLVTMHPEDPDYAIKISEDSSFAASEMMAAAPQIYEDLLKEKESHTNHIVELNARLDKITVLLDALEELAHGNE